MRLHSEESRFTSQLTPRELECLAEFKQNKKKNLCTLKHNKFIRDGIDPSICIANIDTVPTEPSLRSRPTEPSDNVVNLSMFVLSGAHISALSKGLTFCPTSGGFNEFQLLKDLDNFARTMRLREYFHNRENPSDAKLSMPSYKHWTPPAQRDKCLDLYISAVQREILEAYKTRVRYRQNMTKEEKTALEELSNNHDIVIKPADKGGAIVVLNKSDYIMEAIRQLSDTTFYKPLATDPTDNFRSILIDQLTKLLKQKKLDEKTVRSLIPLSPVAGRFYLLPKIHKQGNPGRPIISGVNTTTENLSRYVDSLINEIPGTFPSFVKDTNSFLQDILHLTIPHNSILVTLDVTSLYTNIPHADGISAVLKAYEDCRVEKPVDKETLGSLLKLILELNNFEFNDSHYVQVSGTSMGTRIGPNYANIFMGILENNFLSSTDMQPFFYKRFIDDIFLIWTYGEQNLLKFIDAFNHFHPSIKLSHSYSPLSVNFLDVTVSLCEGKLLTKLYRKPTDKNPLLHFKSSHVRHCKTAIPYSQAHRFKRLCSNREDFIANCEQLKTSLTKRQYPSALIDDAIGRADKLNRAEILRGNRLPEKQNSTNLVLTHSASAPKVHSILKRHYNILAQSEHLKSIFPEPPRVVYRRSKNLRDLLTSSKVNKPEITGCAPCNKARCKVCVHMQTTQKANSTFSDFSLNIRGSFNCDSSNVIYMLECTVCKKQYIGQTETSFRIRFNNHRSHSNKLPSLPLSKHIRLPGHSFENIRATILESGFRSHHDREARESYLIYKFNTVSSGINESTGTLTSVPTKHC